MPEAINRGDGFGNSKPCAKTEVDLGSTKNQQVWFIRSFGANINLGNIQPDDVIPLETLRSLLRGDSFAMFTPTMGCLPLPMRMMVEDLAADRRRIGFPRFVGSTAIFDQ
jgi:hypothetical protein